jgi:hypothetical protein
MRSRLFRSISLLPFVAATAVSASAAITTLPPVYVVGPTIQLPDVSATDLVPVGASLFVGQGTFGAGNQSILRRDPDGTTTTVVTNLNSIGGLAYDTAHDLLLFTDNGGELMGATNGDTVYALANPRAAVAPVDAATLVLRPSGSIPFAQAVHAVPGTNDILVGDAAGPGLGRVVKISGGTQSDFITGLDYVAGITTNFPILSGNSQSFSDTIQVGNVNGSFVPSILKFTTTGVPLGTMNAGPLSGALDHASTYGGNVIVTGGFTDDFSSSTLRLVAQGGSVEPVASGWGFSSGVAYDHPSARALVLDFGADHVDTILNIGFMTPGGKKKQECLLEQWGSPYSLSKGSTFKVLPRWTCTDGDPACDRDLAVNGSCSYTVGTCVRLQDTLRGFECTPVDVETVTITSKKLPTEAAAMQAAVNAILPATTASCAETTLVTVPADHRTRSISFDAKTALGKRLDKDTLKLRCLP